MPRDGGGRADNAVDEQTTQVIHGADQAVSEAQTSHTRASTAI